MVNMPLIKRLKLTSILKPFDCNDSDLNNFFHDDALNHLRHLLAVTYVLESKRQTIAYFSVLNDMIINKDPETNKRISNKLQRKIPYVKHRSSYPAVKIGRFAVHKDYQRDGIGTKLIDTIKVSFTINNKTGCRFITADAYKVALEFYKRNGFDFLTDADKDEDTRLMYFDLFTFRL
jgi:GNAT superfamily N-acetyltransferase